MQKLLTAVRDAADATDHTQRHLHQCVAAARAGGASWTDIGETLGISRQAAQQRFRGAAS